MYLLILNTINTRKGNNIFVANNYVNVTKIATFIPLSSICRLWTIVCCLWRPLNTLYSVFSSPT